MSDILHTQESILERVKAQYEQGPMRSKLCEIFEVTEHTLPQPVYEWMYYAGMGEVAFNDAGKNEPPAIKKLLEQGRLVPTFEDDHYGIKKFRVLQHFDDVKFGVDEDGKLLIYDFMYSADQPDIPDRVIRMDEKYDAVINQLKKRMDFSVPHHAVTIDNAPIRLRGGPVIRPVITDSGLIELRRRQKEFKP